MELIETPIFTKRIASILSDDEYGDMQWVLAINPEAGPIIPGTFCIHTRSQNKKI